jgi:DNA invertase Pin-like site-specific DNA recombinase
VIGSPQLIRRNSQGYRIGECHHNAKLTDDDCRLIRELRDEGLTYKEIAEKFECSLWTVRDIVKEWTR